VLAAVALPKGARASQFIDVVRHHAPVTLKLDQAGQAMVYYAKAGQRHVLVSGAVNARQPTRGVPQVHFRLDLQRRRHTLEALPQQLRRVRRPQPGVPRRRVPRS
jgi:hypothetical protein